MTKSPQRGLCVLLVQGSTYDRLYQACSLTVTWAALGHPVAIFFFYGALAKLVDGRLDAPDFDGPDAERLRTGFERRNPVPLASMLADAKRFGHGVTVGACSGSLDVLGASEGGVDVGIDVVMGLPGILRMAESAERFVTL